MLRRNIKIITVISIIFSFFTLFLSSSNAQRNYNIRRQKLHTLLIDTAKENVFTYEVHNAIIFFRQIDVMRMLTMAEKDSVHLPGYFYKLRDTLNSLQKAIRVKDILYSYDQRERDSITVIDRPETEELELDSAFYFIGASLLLEGSFMLYSKQTNQIVNHHLIAKKRKGIIGGADLMFFLPGGEVLY